MRNWTLRQVYLYLVSFVSLMILIVGLISAVSGIWDYLSPREYAPTGPLEIWTRFKAVPEKAAPPQHVIDEEIAFQRAQQKINAQIAALYQIRKAVAYIAVALPVWFFHWRRVQLENKAHASGPQGVGQDLTQAPPKPPENVT